MFRILFQIENMEINLVFMNVRHVALICYLTKYLDITSTGDRIIMGSYSAELIAFVRAFCFQASSQQNRNIAGNF